VYALHISSDAFKILVFLLTFASAKSNTAYSLAIQDLNESK